MAVRVNIGRVLFIPDWIDPGSDEIARARLISAGVMNDAID